MHGPTIRPATENDLQRLVDVEIEAGQLFHAVGRSKVAEDVPQVADLREAVTAERVWVAEVGAKVAGYVTAELIDGNAHVAQVSVAPDYAGRRIGKAMIEFMEAWGRAAGCSAFYSRIAPSRSPSTSLALGPTDPQRANLTPPI